MPQRILRPARRTAPQVGPPLSPPRLAPPPPLQPRQQPTPVRPGWAWLGKLPVARPQVAPPPTRPHFLPAPLRAGWAWLGKIVPQIVIPPLPSNFRADPFQATEVVSVDVDPFAATLLAIDTAPDEVDPFQATLIP